MDGVLGGFQGRTSIVSGRSTVAMVGRPGQLCYRSRLGLDIGMTLGAVRHHPPVDAGGRRVSDGAGSRLLRAWGLLLTGKRGEEVVVGGQRVE